MERGRCPCDPRIYRFTARMGSFPQSPGVAVDMGLAGLFRAEVVDNMKPTRPCCKLRLCADGRHQPRTSEPHRPGRVPTRNPEKRQKEVHLSPVDISDVGSTPDVLGSHLRQIFRRYSEDILACLATRKSASLRAHSHCRSVMLCGSFEDSSREIFVLSAEVLLTNRPLAYCHWRIRAG